MSAHTPGPWSVAFFDDEPNIAVVQWPYGFAEVRGSRAGREANARLIAEAPNLKFQLLAAANYIEALGGDSSSYRAAIAKAEGNIE